MKIVLRDGCSNFFCRRAALPCLRTSRALGASKGSAPVRHRGNLPGGPPVQPNTRDASHAGAKTKTRLRKLKAKPDPKAVQGKVDTVQQLPVLLKAKAWEEAAKLYLVLRRKNVRVSHAQESLIVKGLCRIGSIRLAWEVYSSLQAQHNMSYTSYHALIKSAVKVKSFPEALSFFEEMQDSGYTPNVVTYCTLINGLLRNRRKGTPYIQVAYNLWKELEASDIPLDAAALRAGCNACVSFGKLQEAAQFIERFRAAGFREDTRVYNMLIKGHCHSGDVQAGWKLMKSMQGCGIQPDQVSYNTLIHGYVSLNDMPNALSTLEDARRESVAPDVCSYTTILKGYVKQNKMKKARALFEEMKDSNFEPSMATYGSLIDGYVQGGDMRKAREIVRVMIEAGTKPNTLIFNILLKGNHYLSSQSWFNELDELLEELTAQDIEVPVDTYNAIMACGMRRHDGKFVLRTLRQMLTSGIRPDAVSWTIVMQAYLAEGYHKSAQMAFNQIEESPHAGMDQVALNANVARHVRKGDLNTANIALQESLEFAQSRNMPPPVEAFDAIITGYAKRRNVHQAISAFRQFYQLGGQPDERMCKRLLKLCIQQKEKKSAQKVLRVMKILGFSLKETYLSEKIAPENTNTQRVDVERLKFWFGLPNDYYDSSWP